MRHTVLCVDDDSDLLIAYQRFLRNNYDVRVASNGPKALAMMEKEGPFAVVVADLHMKEMDGIRLLSIIRENYPDSVRVLVTGNGELEDVIQAVNSGHLFRFLSKPFKSTAFCDAIHAAVAHYDTIQNNQKRVQDALQASEELSRAVLDSMLALIAVLDRNGVIMAVNTPWVNFGIENNSGSPEDANYLGIGVNYLDVCRKGLWAFSDQAVVVADGIQAVLEGKRQSFELEYSCQPKDGKRYFMLSVTPLSSAIGGVVVSHTEITGRVLAEQALRISEDRYRQVLKDQTEVVCRFKRDGTITFVSEVFCRLVGKSPEDLWDQPWQPLAYPEDIPNIELRLSELSQANPVVRIEYRVKDAEGSLRWMEFVHRGVFDSNDQLVEIQAVGRDVTERRRAEAALQLRDRAIRAVSQGIVITDPTQPDNPIVYANPGFEKMTGYEEKESIGRNCRFLQGKDTDPKAVARLREAVRQGESCTVSLLNYRKNQTVFWNELSIAPIRDENGQITHFIGVQSDVTERCSLEEQLRQAQKLESIGQLAAGVAHEINTPIQYIGDNTRFLHEAFTELLSALNALESHSLSGTESEHLTSVQRHSNTIDVAYFLEEVPRAIAQTLEGIGHVAKIVKAMKEFSHPGTNEKSSVDINHTIETVIAVARNEWKYVAEIETDLDPNLPSIPGMPSELNQVFLNLLVNAAHAIKSMSGSSFGGEHKGKIKFTSRRVGNFVEVRVSDTGTGIPEEIRSRIFDPFFTTKPLGQGTGQGLALVHSAVVQRHGGTVTFESQIGYGTVFIVRLPRY